MNRTVRTRSYFKRLNKMEENGDCVCNGLEAVSVKIVRGLKEFRNNEGFFKPDMCHQVFGQSETIYGYKNLKIRLYFDAFKYWCYVRSSYDFKAKPDLLSGLSADDYMEKLRPWLPKDHTTEENIFLNKISKAREIKLFGQLVTSFEMENGKLYEVRTADINTEGYTDFHQRMESLIVWFIDAANLIDITDRKWRFYILYEKTRETEDGPGYPLGYSTVYEYYAFPNHRRYRISQFIIFPPYQHAGLGTELLKGIYIHLRSLPNVLDITVEDPSEKFQTLRDYVDVKLCKTLSVFNPLALKRDFSKKMVKEARDVFKLTEKQIRRVFEIMKLEITSDDDYSSYEKMIKLRLGKPSGVSALSDNCKYKQDRKHRAKPRLFNGAKMKIDEQHADHHHGASQGVLEKEYQLLIAHYRHVLRRLERDR